MKNTMAVVQAITSQSFRNASSMEDAEQSISARINAYSKAHDILLQQDWLGTTMFSAPSSVQGFAIGNLIKSAFVPNPGLAGHDRGRNLWAVDRFSPFANQRRPRCREVTNPTIPTSRSARPSI